MKSSSSIRAVFATVVLIITAQIVSAQAGGKKVPIDFVVQIQRGLPLERVEELFGTTGRHQFFALITTQSIRCVSFSFDSRGSYYFVFTNKALAKICELPKLEFKSVPYKETFRGIPIRANPERRMMTVLDSQDLIGPALAESLKKRTPPSKSGSMNVLPAFIIAAPFLATAGSFRAEQRAEIEGLAKRFDPLKVRHEMSVEEVEKMFGKPHHKEIEAQRETRYYGYARLGANALLWIAVAFEDGRAVRVFTDDFFDMNKIFKQY